MTTVSVRTTQNVSIEYPIAGVGNRILAYIIDGLIITAYCAILLLGVLQNVASGAGAVLVIILIFLPVFFYHLLFEIFMNGQSPGKRQVGIRVIRLDGTPATVGNYLLRWLFRPVECNALGAIIIAVSRKGQRIGDMVAGTTVIKVSPQDTPSAADEIGILTEPDYQPVFPQAAQLSDADIEVIRQALAASRDSGNRAPVEAAAERVKSRFGISSDFPAVKFLYTVLRDYTHLMQK